MTIIAAADGSALGNPGPAGWAWYIDAERWRCGGWKKGTNNQGELSAVLDLLRQTEHSDEPLHVLCDSQYVINSITKWIKDWKRKGWKKADGKPVLNVELMKALDEAMSGRTVTFEWVKGHAGHELNEKADVLANGAAKAYASGERPEAGPGFPGARSVGAGDDPAAPPPPEGSADNRSADMGRSAGGSTGRSSGAATSSSSSPTAEPDLFSLDDEPAPATAPSTVDQVVALERSLLTTAVRTDRAQLSSLLDPAWSHVCARGELWSLQDRLEAADQATAAARTDDGQGDGRSPGEPSMDLLEARELSADVVLLVWRERSAGGAVLRNSVWRRLGGQWRQTFQQGTPE